MSITSRPFGTLSNGSPVTLFTLSNSAGMEVEVLSYAASIRSIRLPDRAGRVTDVALGYETALDYEQDVCFFGNLVGRFANRLRGARFSLDGTEYRLTPNEGANHLHGSYCRRNFQGEIRGDQLVFSFLSPDGEEGFPGNLQVTYRYQLREDNTLLLDYKAVTDRATILNLTNHVYLNLSGHASGDVLSQHLRLDASRFTETDRESLLTGAILPAEGTPFDFRAAKTLGRDIQGDHPMLAFGSGYDLNLVLDRPSMDVPCGESWSDETGIRLRYFTTQPGTQLYSGNFIAPQGPRPGKDGALYGNRQGFCLESQNFPCAPDFTHFPSAVLRPGEVYHHQTAYQFTADR